MSSIPSEHELSHILREDKNASPPRVVSPLVPPRRRGERRADDGHLMNSSNPPFILRDTDVTEGIRLSNEEETTTVAGKNATDKDARVRDRDHREGEEGNAIDTCTAESSGLFTPTTRSANASKDHSPMRSTRRRERRREGGSNSPRPSSTASTSASSSPSKGSHAQHSRRSFQEVLYQHQSHRAPLDPVAEKWMTILGTGTIVRSTLGEASMAMIPMLGTHDSATYGIHELSDFAADAPKILDQIPRYLMGYTKKLVSHWARCQSVSMLEQLFRGVRYFDVRLCPRKKGSKVTKRHPKDICHTRIHPPPEIAERAADLGLAELYKIPYTPFEKPVTVADKAEEHLDGYVFPPPSSAGGAGRAPQSLVTSIADDEERERSKQTRGATKDDDTMLRRTDSCSSSTFGRSSDSNYGSGTFSNFVGSPTADERTAMLRQFTGAKDPTRSLHLHSGDGNAALEPPESSFSSFPRPPPSLFSSPNLSRSHQKGSEGVCPITSTSYAEAVRDIIASGKAPGLTSPNTSRPLFGDVGLPREESKLIDGKEENRENSRGPLSERSVVVRGARNIGESGGLGGGHDAPLSLSATGDGSASVGLHMSVADLRSDKDPFAADKTLSSLENDNGKGADCREQQTPQSASVPGSPTGGGGPQHTTTNASQPLAKSTPPFPSGERTQTSRVEQSSHPPAKAPTVAPPQPANPYEDELWVTHSSISLPLQVIVQELCIFYSSILEPVREGRYRGDGYGTSMAYRRGKRAEAVARRKKDQKQYNYLNTSSSAPRTQQGKEMPSKTGEGANNTANDGNKVVGFQNNTSDLLAVNPASFCCVGVSTEKSSSLTKNSRASLSSSSLSSVIIHKRTETAVGCFDSFAADTLNGCVEGEDEHSPYEMLFPPATALSQSEAGSYAQEPLQSLVCADATTAHKFEKCDIKEGEDRPVASTPLHGRWGTALPLASSNNSPDHSHGPSPNNRLPLSNLNGETPPPRSPRQARLSEVEAEHINKGTLDGVKKPLDSSEGPGESPPTALAKSISANSSEADTVYATDDEVGSTDLDLGQEALNYRGEQEACTDTDDYEEENEGDDDDDREEEDESNRNLKQHSNHRGPRDHDFLATNLEVIVLDFQRCTNFTPQHVKTFLDIMSPLMPLFVRKPKNMSTPLKELWQTPERIFVFFPTNTMTIGRDILSIPYLSPEDFRKIVEEGGVEERKKQIKNKECNEGGADEQQRLDQAVVAIAPSADGARQGGHVMGTEDSREMQKSGDLCSSRTGAVVSENEREKGLDPQTQSSSYSLSPDPRTCTRSHVTDTNMISLQASPTTQYIVDDTAASVASSSTSSSSSVAPPPSSAASAISGISSVPSHLRGSRAGRTPMDFLYRRDDTVIVSKWFNRRVELPLFRDAQQELYERSLVPIHHRTQLHVLQGVLTPTTQDLVQSILQRNPKAKSILEYACDVNSVLLGIWESHGEAHRHITFPLEAADDGRGKGLSKLGTIGSAFLFGGLSIGGGGVEHDGAAQGGSKRGHSRSASTQSSTPVVDPLLPGRSVAVDGRNILMLDFFQVGRSPLGFDAFTTACWRPCLDRFTNAYAPTLYTPALSIGAFPLRFSAPSLPQTPLIAQHKLALSLAVMGVAGGGGGGINGRPGGESWPHTHVKSFSNASNQSTSGSITVRSTTVLGRQFQSDSGGGNSIVTLSLSPSRYTNGTSGSPSSTLSRTVAGLPLYSTTCTNEDNGDDISNPKDEANGRGGAGLSATLQVLSRVVGSIATRAGVQRATLGGGHVVGDRGRSPPYGTTVHDLAVAAANKAVDAVVTQPTTYMRVQLDNLLEGRPIHLDPIGGRVGEVSPQDPLGQGGPSYAGASGDGVSEYADETLTVGPPPASLTHLRSRIRGGGGSSRSRSHSSKSTRTPSAGRTENRKHTNKNDFSLTREGEHEERREGKDDTSFLLREQGLAKAVLKSATDVLLMKRKNPLGAATTSSSSSAPEDDDEDACRGDEDEDEAEAIAREKRRMAEASGSYIANANYGRRLSEDDGEGGRRFSGPFIVDPCVSSVSLGGAAGIAMSSSPKKGHLSRSSAAVGGGGHAASSGSFLRFPSLSISSLTRRRETAQQQHRAGRGGKDHHDSKAGGHSSTNVGRKRSASMSSSTAAFFSYRRYMYVGNTIVKSGSYLWSWAIWPAKLVAASSSYCLDSYRKAKPQNATAGEGECNDNRNVNAQPNGSAHALEEEDDSPLASYAHESDLRKANEEMRRLSTTTREDLAT